MNNTVRVAWLLPIAWFYWQPALSEFTKYFPETKVFTGLFPGFARGYENALDVEVVGSLRNIPLAKNSQSYDATFSYLSPEIIKHLWDFKPNLVFSSSFGIWTLLALLFKFIGRWQVIIAYEGSSPGVDYLNSPLRLSLRKIMVKFADGYISNSERGRKYLIDVLRADRELVRVQPYEVPSAKSLIERNSDSSENLSITRSQEPVFLFVGHLISRKGIKTLLEACHILHQQGYSNYTVQIIGSGEEQQKLQKYCVEQDIAARVRWLGRIEYSEIDFYFRNADVFVFPTYEETWGVVLLEAMLFGKAVISSTGAGTSELVVENENGYLFEPDCSEMLAKLMIKFIERPNLIGQMGEKSQKIMSCYTPEIAGKALADLALSLKKKERVYA